MGLHKLRIFSKAKDALDRTKWQLIDLEKIFTSGIGLISNIYKEYNMSNSKKTNNHNTKWSAELNKEFSILSD